MSKELIRLKNLVMEFDGERILDNINLYINDHEFLTLLGPSGCGKTTTLRIIGGFLTPTSGEVLFDGARMNDVPAYKRQINTVFQRYALFPHLDVYDNIAFGLRIAKLSKAEIHTSSFRRRFWHRYALSQHWHVPLCHTVSAAASLYSGRVLQTYAVADEEIPVFPALPVLQSCVLCSPGHSSLGLDAAPGWKV